ncbi:tumor necrosis factor alpha-induced protein 8-like protein isoform X1 [Copidosoma floridanum]|uniref:tumor necrosis factor alpha-induced protein 8-like protein isoform X1 n=1 Tax=Copidosoma floridanum TaxID=29053 RepID=UPI0006C990AE|nr:tumor necrosis factor alpha-induced protein 8-like protein isoform X1 [Copidosoma floridanum]
MQPKISQMIQSAATGGELYPVTGTSKMPSEVDAATAPASTGSRARDLGLRAQKKLLDRFAASAAGRSLLIDDTTASLLDNLYRLMDRAARASPRIDKKQPEKVLKNIVKLSIKIGLLHRNQQLGPSDAGNLEEIRRALHSTAMVVLSFYELEFSYERAYLVKSLERCRAAVRALIKPHLTEKSRERCEQVFDFLVHPDFLEAVFANDSELRPVLGALVGDINKALETGEL